MRHVSSGEVEAIAPIGPPGQAGIGCHAGGSPARHVAADQAAVAQGAADGDAQLLSRLLPLRLPRSPQPLPPAPQPLTSHQSLIRPLASLAVHEKSILLPLLPASLLALEEASLYRWLCPLACFSMYPLLARDGLGLPYAALLLLFFLLFGLPGGRDNAGSEQKRSNQRPSQQPSEAPSQHSTGESTIKLNVGGGEEEGVFGRMWGLWERVEWIVFLFSLLGAIGLHIAAAVVTPPERYPYLHPALMTTYAFIHFVPIALYSNLRQWAERGEDLYDKKIE